MLNQIDLSKYFEMARRRRWWLIVPFLATILGGMAYLMAAPRTYEASTLILVQPQKVPQDYVRAIISTSVEDRLRTMTQQITSRSNLEGIIRQCGLLRENGTTHMMHRTIVSVRKRIVINVSGGGRGGETSAFTITFRDRNPRNAMLVANALATNFIKENLSMRESLARGTSSFLSDELTSIESRLIEKEAELKQYREKFMGGLPEQLSTNLAILERLQGQLEQQMNRLRDSEYRVVLIDNQIMEAKNKAVFRSDLKDEVKDLTTLKRELASLEVRYTPVHPDVVRLRELVARLKGKGSLDQDLIDPTLLSRRQEMQVDIKSLKEEIKETQAQIAWYEAKVDETPKREQELLTLKRDYGNLKEAYNSLLGRRLEAEIAVSLEQRQEGEQFRIIDTAKIPEAPIEPDMRKIAILTLLLGLGLGVGLTYLVEATDPSFKSPDELEDALGLPVLVTMPMAYSDEEKKSRRFKDIMAYASVTAGFFFGLACIFFASGGI